MGVFAKKLELNILKIDRAVAILSLKIYMKLFLKYLKTICPAYFQMLIALELKVRLTSNQAVNSSSFVVLRSKTN